MCGRFTLTSSGSDLARVFSLSEVPELGPRYNIAPTQQIAAVRARATGERAIDFLRWGLIPAWAKDRSIGNRTFNARAETAAEKPAFRSALRQRRCLVPASGFFEWTGGKGARTAHLFQLRDGEPFAIAGLWEKWKAPDAAPDDGALESCTLLTTEANAFMRPFHHRMPVILAHREWTTWLDASNSDAQEAHALLVPCPPDWLEEHSVGSYVNDVRNEGPRCIDSDR